MSQASVVIATLGRATVLRRVLDLLEHQDAGTDTFEVVVGVDAAERDLEAVRAAARDRPFPVRVAQADVPGVSAARNRAWPLATAPVVVFLGDDMLPAPDLIRRHLAHHRAHPEAEAALLGHARWARELRRTPLMRWLDQEGMQFDFRTVEGTEAYYWHFYAANASLKAERLEQVGGYDETFRFGYEELDLAVRLDRIGFRLTYDPQAEVEHLHPPTLEGWRQRMRVIAYAEQQFVTKHPDLPPHFRPLFERIAAQSRTRAAWARLAERTPEGLPGLGPLAWRNAGFFYGQQLADAFLAAQAAESGGANVSSTRAGTPPTTE